MKATHGFKGQIAASELYSGIDQLRNITGPTANMVFSTRWPEVAQPAWFFEIDAAGGWRGGSSGAGTIDFRLYVNDENLAVALCLLQ